MDESRERDAYNELYAYTLTHADIRFIHQHVVDAWAAQHATDQSKPIGITFALVGLYLHVEKQYTGRQVQRAHMTMGQRKRQWPSCPLPRDRGSMTAIDVMAAPEGPAREQAIDAWCVSVWSAFRQSQLIVEQLLREYEIS